jgi:hypothetical protein
MADKNSLVQYAVQQIGPEKLQQLVDQAEQELSQDPDVTQEALDELVQQLNYVAENPEAYKEVVTSAIQAGLIDPEDVPPEFDPMFVAVMLIAVTELSHRVIKQGSKMFARGGLAQQAKNIAAQGRGGDTMLAHINPKEAEVLRRMGGSGTINPNTGLHEFKGGIFKSIGKIFKSVAKIAIPVVANIIAPGWGGMLAGAAMGAAGGGGLKGAVLGGLTGSLGSGGFLGGAANSVGQSVLGTGIGKMLGNTIGAQTLGAGLLGGAASAALGQGFLPGALAAGSMSSMTPTITGLANSAKGLFNSATGPGSIFSSQAGGTGVNLGSSGGLNQVGSNLMSGSGAPAVNAAGAQVAKDAIAANMANGVPGFSLADLTAKGFAPGVTLPSSSQSLFNLAPPTSSPVTLPKFNTDASVYDSALNFNPSIENAAVANAGFSTLPGAVLGGAKDSGILGTGISGSNALMGLTMLGGLTPPQALSQIEGSGLTPEQKAAMGRALTNYTAKYNMVTLPNQGTPEYDDMMSNISQGIGINFMNPTITNNDTGTTTPMKRGGKARVPAGGLSQIAMLAQGTGSGRDDTINAKLSDGEYVIDAETVALLGNGSTKAGAMALDQMREQIRQQKGKALAKGKFSPNAKSPLAYMKGGLK